MAMPRRREVGQVAEPGQPPHLVPCDAPVDYLTPCRHGPSQPRLQQQEFVRALVISTDAIDPAQRGKLRALEGMGCAIALAVPADWPQGLPRVEWGADGGIKVAPIQVRGGDEPATLRGWGNDAPSLVDLAEGAEQSVTRGAVSSTGLHGDSLQGSRLGTEWDSIVRGRVGKPSPNYVV